MSTVEPGMPAEQTLSREDVRGFRQAAIANGYPVIRVRSADKRPIACEWQHGEDPNVLLDVQPPALNTGLLLAGLRCIDVDVDDRAIVDQLMEHVQAHLPAGALIRRRANSARLAIFFRAPDGQQPRREAIGRRNCKIEVLGAGQQAVVHGLHPSGAALTWEDGRGPDTVPLHELPTVSEEQIGAFLSACAPLLGGAQAGPESTSPLGSRLVDPGVLPARASPSVAPGLHEFTAGIGTPNWFSELTEDKKKELVAACLDALDNRTNDPRETWVPVLFAVADAERLGCPDARQLALEWSQRGASWTSEVDFDKAWNSYEQNKPRAVTIGTLLGMARSAGLDLGPWRDPVLTRSNGAADVTPGAAAIRSELMTSASPRALCIAALPSMPSKRQWLHGFDVVRGAVSLLVAPGARGKSSWLVTLSLACAAGRPLLGAHVFGGPLRVLLISAEDPLAEVALRIRAAMQHYGLTDADVPGLHVIGADHWGISLLAAGGSGPILSKAGWDTLTAELDRVQPDVLILDPLISVMGGASQNDNAAAALFMGQLVGLAAKRRIGVMVAHHASKGRDPISAESAMGAASFVNLSRIALGIEPLAEKDAGNLGLPPWEARDVFRVVGTKHNLSPPAEGDRWFRLVSVEMCNAEPPTYPNGDKVGVVEEFRPGSCGPRFSPQMVRDALRAIHGSTTPLSPSKRATGRYAAPTIAQAISPHRGGHTSEIEAEAVLDHLIRSDLVRVDKVKVPRPGGRSDERDGLVLTPAGKDAIGAQPTSTTSQPSPQPPQPPQRPATSMRDDAGGAPPAPPQRQGGYGGNAGAHVAGGLDRKRTSNAGALSRPTAAHLNLEPRYRAIADALLALGPDALPPTVAKAVISAVTLCAATEAAPAAPEMSDLIHEPPPVAPAQVAAVASPTPGSAAPEPPTTACGPVGGVCERSPNTQVGSTVSSPETAARPTPPAAATKHDVDDWELPDFLRRSPEPTT